MSVTDAIDTSVDTPPIQGSKLPSDLERWFATLTDQLNSFFGNIIAEQSADLGGQGASFAVTLNGISANSVVIPVIKSSTNPVSVQSVVSSDNQFTLTLSGDPGASLFIKYVAFRAPLLAQGVQ